MSAADLIAEIQALNRALRTNRDYHVKLAEKPWSQSRDSRRENNKADSALREKLRVAHCKLDNILLGLEDDEVSR